jgi:DNA-binding helix-hairpin-helix protein with protein kinase domain
MHVYNEQGKQIPLGEELSRNEKASVYRIPNNTMFVVKVYHTPTEEGERKIATMIANTPYDPNQTCGHTSIAWPRWMIYQQDGTWTGYAMDYVGNTRTLGEIFDPAVRARNHFDSRHTYRAARYIASSLHALHSDGYVVGDLNPDDIIVTPSARITIVTADSFQVEERRDSQTVLHPCRQPRPPYRPPELQGVDVAGVRVQQEHDRFALGVIIFQLLMDGRHPFEGEWQGEGEPPALEERIRLGMFPYATEAGNADGLLVPPDGLSLDALPPILADMVRRCFCAGVTEPSQRPLAQEWEHMFDRVEHHLVPCVNAHMYPDHLAACPICGAARADEKTARRLAKTMAEPAPVCPLPNQPSPPQSRPWLWPVVVGVVVVILVGIMIGVGGGQMLVGG